MEDKTRDIVDAARAMFTRYGFAKTTMSDIAAEAGVARQTVYNAFDSKEDILRAVVRQVGEESFADVEAVWAEDRPLAEKLAAFQQMGPLRWFEAVEAAPDLRELLDGINAAAAEELSCVEDKWVTALRDLLADHVAEHRNEGPPLEQVAEFFFSASKNAKYGVRSLPELKKRLDTILAATLALVRSRR